MTNYMSLNYTFYLSDMNICEITMLLSIKWVITMSQLNTSEELLRFHLFKRPNTDHNVTWEAKIGFEHKYFYFTNFNLEIIYVAICIFFCHSICLFNCSVTVVPFFPQLFSPDLHIPHLPLSIPFLTVFVHGSFIHVP